MASDNSEHFLRTSFDTHTVHYSMYFHITISKSKFYDTFTWITVQARSQVHNDNHLTQVNCYMTYTILTVFYHAGMYTDYPVPYTPVPSVGDEMINTLQPVTPHGGGVILSINSPT